MVSFGIFLIVIFNILSHLFLMRFFVWHDPDSKLKLLHNRWFKIALLVPPIALLVATFLIILGLILKK
jgi:hypothetical protein